PYTTLFRSIIRWIRADSTGRSVLKLSLPQIPHITTGYCHLKSIICPSSSGPGIGLLSQFMSALEIAAHSEAITLAISYGTINETIVPKPAEDFLFGVSIHVKG